MNYSVNEHGYYGEFGGAFIPEMLYPNVEELRMNYLQIISAIEFQKEFHLLLIFSWEIVSMVLTTSPLPLRKVF